ncbi:TfoX/Sxy family protein [Ponticaulis sp.]|uniref:TfoX/Sxy family protein n=1 Tax=Ponticaulis sp. TaxID=2020902 RepID=UPI000C4972D2|nr:TfoX/Sxy family protein [Ponticaulis sp.]MAJ10491.1 competence protein TfoX [Ponticaulis sp.]HBH89460.1 competence protein TfoX [Hyphomonadaceae bacterium]HBJ94310.1 competence protein TfoX [Hyphomonadaceae bacterium]|tara:strand:- start:18954 stop:19292 length:339 start_codon:yes stop_codon:yes gene_type:complete
MATSQSTVDYILDQLSSAGEVSARKMFGEFGLYCDGKFVASVCDDTLFIKPTKQGYAFAPEQEMAPPYDGAKDQFMISGDQLEDADWVSELLRITTAALPAPKPKKKKQPEG